MEPHTRGIFLLKFMTKTQQQHNYFLELSLIDFNSEIHDYIRDGAPTLFLSSLTK